MDIDDWLDMMPDTMTAQPVTTDEYGEPTNNGSAVSVTCYIEGGNRQVKIKKGKDIVELTSTVQVYTGGVFSLTVDAHVYTLPSRFDPNSRLEAISVERVSDEDGPHHEVVMFP